MTSIAAAVLGGAALTGGRGSFVGALLGALFFTLTVNIIALLGLNTGAGIMTSGALTLFALALYSGLQPIRRVWANMRAAFDRWPQRESAMSSARRRTGRRSGAETRCRSLRGWRIPDALRGDLDRDGGA